MPQPRQSWLPLGALFGLISPDYLGFRADFKKAIDNGNWETAQRLAHSLKGAARSLGINVAGDFAARLEAAVKQAGPGEVQETLAVLVIDLEKVGAGLNTIGR